MQTYIGVSLGLLTVWYEPADYFCTESVETLRAQDVVQNISLMASLNVFVRGCRSKSREGMRDEQRSRVQYLSFGLSEQLQQGNVCW